MARLASAASSVPTVNLRSLLDASPEPLIVFDPRGLVLLANRAALRLCPCEPGQTLAQLEAVLGPDLVQWLQRQRGTGTRGPAATPALTTRLPDGRLVQAGLQPLELGQWALRLQPSPAEGAQAGTGGAGGAGGEPSVRTRSGRELVRVVWRSPFPAFVLDAQFRILAVNQAYVDFTGYAPERVLGLDPVMLQPEADRAASLAAREWLRDEPGERHAVLPERRLIDARGRERWYRVARLTLKGERGEPLLLSVLQDCTAERVAREQADRSVRELDEWFDLSPVGMVLFDDGGLLVRSNLAFEGLVGQAPVAVPDAPVALQALLAWGPGGADAQLAPGAPPLERKVSLQRPDGKRLRLRALVRGFETGAGQRRYMAVVEDRSLEEERELAQLEIGALMDTASIGVATFEESQGWLRNTPSGNARQGGPAGLQSISRELVEPDSLPEYERLQKALKAGERAQVKYAVRHADLGQRWLLTRVEPGRLGSGRRTTSVVTLDITEQEQARARNDTLLRELETLLDTSSAGIAYLRGEVLVRCNQRFERMLGLAGDAEMAGAALSQVHGLHPAVHAALQQALAALRSARVFEAEFPLQAGDMLFPAWYSLSVRRADTGQGDHMEAVAVLTDVSRLKAQQAELEELLRERDLMFNLSDVGIAYLRGGRIERANQALAAMTGYAAAELAQLPHAELFEDATAHAAWQQNDEAMLRQRGFSSSERRLRRRDGSLLWVQVSKRLVDEADPDAGAICSYVDVDERQRGRQSLVLQAERTRALLDSVLVGIVTVGEDGIEWMNRSARRMFGGELADFVGEPIHTVATPEPDHPLRRTHYLGQPADGRAESFECRLKARDGREFWVVGNAVATGRGPAERQVTFALLDIERRRQAEISIAQARASLQSIIETAPLAIGLLDAATTRVLQLNQMAATFSGTTIEAAVGKRGDELFEPSFAEQLRIDIDAALASREVTRREYHRTVNGELQVWDARYVTLPGPGGPDAPPAQLLFVASDVTEQREAEAARYEAAIAQRDMLVKEVHHRIKNNLQGVAGLMQQIAQRRPEVAGVISEAVGQVQAIAQVYGLQVGVAGPLRVKSVVEAIATSVQRMFGRAIRVEVQGEAPHRWALPEAESIPIALTVNELLTNAIKHSPGGDVRCSVKLGDGQVTIAIANQGRLPPDFSLAGIPGGVSGLGLVRALLPRRHATLTLAQEGDEVVARIAIVPPGVTELAPL
jgi:PAS domain S-box-containing protein